MTVSVSGPTPVMAEAMVLPLPLVLPAAALWSVMPVEGEMLIVPPVTLCAPVAAKRI